MVRQRCQVVVCAFELVWCAIRCLSGAMAAWEHLAQNRLLFQSGDTEVLVGGHSVIFVCHQEPC